jgi:lipid II:glycine glycyltransferase (peptidoglycan interpeptide bridge formation enzyme)
MYIKQSKNWEKYFNSIGWKSFRVNFDILVVYRSTFFGRLAKIQRPKKLNINDLLEIDKKCVENKISFLKIEPDENQNIDTLKTVGFIKSNSPLSPTSTTYIKLDLSEKSLWNNLTKSEKYGINRGQRDGSKVEFIKNPSNEDLNNYFKDIQSYTSKDKGFKTLSLKELLLVNKAFNKNTYISIGYDINENISGGKFYLINEDTVFYLTGGTTELGKHTRVGFVQMWESIKFFKNLGYKKLDLDGIYDSRFHNFTKSWIGFTDFKKKFGGEIIKYPNPYNKYYSNVLLFLTKIPFLKIDF